MATVTSPRLFHWKSRYQSGDLRRPYDTLRLKLPPNCLRNALRAVIERCTVFGGNKDRFDRVSRPFTRYVPLVDT